MEQQTEKEIAQEKEMVPLELIQSCSWVLQHPILRPIVEAAPSPTAADRYIVSSFDAYEHKNELARGVRRAVHLRERLRSDSQSNRFWQELIKPSKDYRLCELFLFGEETSYRAIHSDRALSFAKGLKYLPDDAKAVDCSYWPLALQEYKYITGSSLTGHCGNKISAITEMEKLDNDLFSGLGDLDPYRHIAHGFDIDMVRTGSGTELAKSRIYLNDHHVSGCLIQIAPQAGEIFPRFYKILSLRNSAYDPSHSINVTMPLDRINDEKTGEMVFRKKIHLSEGRDCDSHGLEAFLQFKFSFGKDFVLCPTGGDRGEYPDSFIQIRQKSKMPGMLFANSKPADSETVCSTMAVLYNDFLAAYPVCLKSRINLHDVIGQKVIDNPPENLLQLFTQKR